ncbi:MAG: glycosyltransferase, partial [Thermoplasmata archaeon]
MEDRPKPYISVIITAYNRKEYLLDAFKSAINQTLPRDKYKIIISKNFKDKKIDNYILKHGGKLVLFKKKGIGPRIANALRYAKGEVVCFLEDDDLFDRNKLKFVYDIFARTPKLCYCHNGIIYVD